MNNKLIIVVIIVGVVVLGGYFLLASSTYKTGEKTIQVQTPAAETSPIPNSETSPQETTPTSETPSSQNVVIYTDSGYSPNTLSIKKGETVVFQNNSSQSMWTASALHPTHTVYSGTSLSEHCGSSNNTAFDACKGIQPGDSWSFTFNKVGSWKYHNHLNPSHTGTIIVE